MFTFGIVPCAKDTDKLLELTIYPYINKGLAVLNNYTHIFVSKEENNIIIDLVKPTIEEI